MESNNKVHLNKNTPHWVSAHSYAMYFALFLAGVTLDLIYKLNFFNNSSVIPIGVIFLIFATFLILWTEHTSRNLGQTINKEAFYRGPYRFTRSPIHWGLLFLILGFGLIANAFFVVLSTIISFLVAKFIFQHKEERILEKKYGSHYIEYKRSVKL